MSDKFIAPVKDPDAVLDHGMDWREWLDEDETISGTPAVAASPSGLTITQVSQADGIVRWRVSGGTAGQYYQVTCRITTSRGRIDERTVRYRVANR